MGHTKTPYKTQNGTDSASLPCFFLHTKTQLLFVTIDNKLEIFVVVESFAGNTFLTMHKDRYKKIKVLNLVTEL